MIFFFLITLFFFVSVKIELFKQKDSYTLGRKTLIQECQITIYIFDLYAEPNKKMNVEYDIYGMSNKLYLRCG